MQTSETIDLTCDCPGLLLSDEVVHLAFKAVRDKFFFTSHRILVQDKQGITGKRAEYKSLPYASIKVLVKSEYSLRLEQRNLSS